MPYSTAGKNLMLAALAGTNPTTPITHVSLHTDLPNDSGSNEATGGSPAYARKAVAFASPASGSMDKDATDPVFDVPAGTYFYAGFWSASTAGTFLSYAPINGGTLRGVGTASTADVITSNGHGLADTNRVTLQTVAGESLPTGLSATVIYFVVSSATNTFSLSLTSGGSAVDITAVGELAWQKVIPEVYASQGTLTIDTATLDQNG